MKQDINTIEGALHKLKINFTGDVDFADYTVYGSCAPFGCCKCEHFEVAEKTESGAVLIIPALNYGIYQYQLFIKQTSTEVEYLILSGDIIVQDRLCGCASTEVNDGEVTIIDATISADTVEVNVSINKGPQDEDDDKDTTSSFSWGDYYIGLNKGYPTKYKDCHTTDDMSNISSEWRKDLTENGEWNYALDNLNEETPDFKRWFSEHSSDYGDLRSFNSYMPNVTNLYQSFQWSRDLESWSCPTPQCTRMDSAFYGCTKLKHFRGDLSKLLNGDFMFGETSSNCAQLDLASVQHIANVINPNGNYFIYLGVSNTLKGNSEFKAAIQQIRDKGWSTVYFYSDHG